MESFTVVIWFNNGESRSFRAIETFESGGTLVIKQCCGETAYFRADSIAGFQEPTDDEVTSGS